MPEVVRSWPNSITPSGSTRTVISGVLCRWRLGNGAPSSTLILANGERACRSRARRKLLTPWVVGTSEKDLNLKLTASTKLRGPDESYERSSPAQMPHRGTYI